MEPTQKAPEIKSLLESMAGRTTAIKADGCLPPPMGCGEPATNFHDDLSRREYRISGFCQKCQDAIFGSSED